MTNKEFEAKKQEIIELVYKTDKNSNNLVPTTAMRIILTKAINKLQPPRLTCSSCKYGAQHKTNEDGTEVAIKCGEGVGVIDYEYLDPTFGCNWHSFYGDAK